MKLVFSGFERAIELNPGEISTLQVENAALFTRVVLSLQSGLGRTAIEPYSFWDDETEIKASSALMLVTDPMNLPWDEKSLASALMKRIEREYLEDEELRMRIDSATHEIKTNLMTLGFGFNSDIGFNLEWDLKKYLKLLGFGVTFQEEKSFLDNLLNFLSLTLDAGNKKTLAFVNLKTFLTENELKTFLDQVFFLKLNVLLLENKHDSMSYGHEHKYTIDLQFLEY